MFAAAFAAGFGFEESAALGRAAWAPDTDSRNAMSASSIFAVGNRNQEDTHLLDHGDPSVMVPFIDGVTQEVLERFAVTKQLNSADEVALHRFGDSRAHINADTGSYYSAGLGHALDGSAPDDPYYNPEAFMDYGLTAYDMMAKANGGNVRMSRSEFSDILRGITKQSSEAAQMSEVRGAYKNYLEGNVFPEPERGWGLLGTGE